MNRVIENFASLFWFLMDVFWSCGLNTLAAVMIVPTVYSNMLMFKHTRKNISDILVCTATNAWVLMNVCWMVPDVMPWESMAWVFTSRWVFLVIASVAMLLIMITDFNKLKEIRRFRK